MPITYCIPGNPNTNIHYATLSDVRRDNTIYASQEPEIRRSSAGKLGKQIDYRIRVDLEGKLLNNRNPLCPRN